MLASSPSRCEVDEDGGCAKVCKADHSQHFHIRNRSRDAQSRHTPLGNAELNLNPNPFLRSLAMITLSVNLRLEHMEHVFLFDSVGD